jgi:hypothetical protein
LCLGRGVIYTRHRLIWVTVGLGCMAWGAGDFYYTFVVSKMKEIPVPPLADPVYLVFYPLLFVGGVLLFRTRSGRASAVQWLDGLSAALAAAALSAAVALDAVLGTLGGKPLADATNLAYPSWRSSPARRDHRCLGALRLARRAGVVMGGGRHLDVLRGRWRHAR